MTDQALLLTSVALLSVYVVGIGGTTASALRVLESWRRTDRGEVDLRASEVALVAPNLSRVVRVLRTAGWVVFPIALVLGVFANRHYFWVGPVTVLVMVGLNAFYFSAVQGLGERLTLTADGFRQGKRSVRWIHVTELSSAHAGPFGGTRISEPGAWQDPRSHPNVILYRLNRALVRPQKSVLARWGGLTYYDGMIRNAFGISTDRLLEAMLERRRRALEAEGPLKRRAPGDPPSPVRSREA